jgi:hypothetical protein
VEISKGNDVIVGYGVRGVGAGVARGRVFEKPSFVTLQLPSEVISIT